MDMDNQKVKNYKTKEERKDAIRRLKTCYMLSKIWYCEVCNRGYCLARKSQDLKTIEVAAEDRSTTNRK